MYDNVFCDLPLPLTLSVQLLTAPTCLIITIVPYGLLDHALTSTAGHWVSPRSSPLVKSRGPSDGIWERVRHTVWSLSWRNLVTLYANNAKLTLGYIRWLSNWMRFMSRKILFGENTKRVDRRILSAHLPFFSNGIYNTWTIVLQ